MILLYLTARRPYIMLNVCMCARLQAYLRESHFKNVKIILRYLNGTSHHSLWFPKASEYILVGIFILILLVASRIGKVPVGLVTCL